MPRVDKFDQGMIERVLKKMDLKYLKDSDGDYHVQFGYDKETGCELEVLCMAQGSKKEIYVVRVFSTKRVAKKDWAQALMACNAWNTEKRWPKSFLLTDTNDGIGQIILEEQIDLEQGVHEELLEDFTRTVVATAFKFWAWASHEKGL